MGIVSKQGFYNTIAGYAGIAIGFVNTVLLFPTILEPHQYGLTRILLAAATVFAQFSQFGIKNLTIKFFPSFKDRESKHFGIFFFVLIIPLFGFLIFSLLALIFKETIIGLYSKGAVEFVENFNYIFVLAFFLILFGAVDSYMRALYKTVLAYILNNVGIRLIWFFLIIGYYWGLYEFSVFLFWFVFSYGINLVILVIALIRTGQVKLIPDIKNIKKRNLSNIFQYGLYSFLSSGSMFLATRIDVLMIGALIAGAATGGEGLDAVAIYSVAYYIASVIAVPFISMSAILAPVISVAFEKKDWFKLNRVYKQASETLLVMGCLIFLGVWLNVDNLLQILPSEYASGRYVILLIGLARLFSVITGINEQVIQYSDYYRFILFSNIFFVIMIVLTNLIFIPLLDLNGAAIATCLSIVVYNTIKTGFIWWKMKILPLRLKSLLGLLVAAITFLIVDNIPDADNYILDIFITSFVILILYVPAIYFLKVSLEINEYIRKGFALIGIKIP